MKYLFFKLTALTLICDPAKAQFVKNHYIKTSHILRNAFTFTTIEHLIAALNPNSCSPFCIIHKTYWNKNQIETIEFLEEPVNIAQLVVQLNSNTKVNNNQLFPLLGGPRIVIKQQM